MPAYRLMFLSSRHGFLSAATGSFRRGGGGGWRAQTPSGWWVAVLLLLAGSVQAVEKPVGTFSASGAAGAEIYVNANLRGVLVRADWASIEPTPGVFNFAALLGQVNNAVAQGKSWSLAVAGGGVGSPDWLTGSLGAPSISYSFRGVPGYQLPLFWNETVQTRLAGLATALAAQFGSDPNLKLVYVTQMTANGIEGHLQGVDMNTLKAAGYTDERWIEAAKGAARSFATAFADKAIAFEVHDVNGGATVPATIINDLWNDPTLGQRVGAGMWWISGKTSYQGDLVEVLTAYPGDVYGQVIGRSDQPERFEGGDYATVFTQARAIGLRYLEPWEFEFRTDGANAGGVWDATMASFNAWADATYGGDGPPEGGGDPGDPGDPDGAGGGSARLVNLSVRSAAGSGDATLIVGYVAVGSGTQDVLVRGIGPGLAAFEVADPLAAPRLRLLDDSGHELAQNAGWGGGAELADVFARVGAFALATDSNDAALVASSGAGLRSVQLTTEGGTSGVALVEVYEAGSTGDIGLANLSARTVAGSGDAVLVAGFVLAGEGERRVLLRGVGPSLIAHGIEPAAVLVDPRMVLYRDQTALAENDNWSGTEELLTAFKAVGAFALDGPGSADAAMVVTLPAGGYTVHVSGGAGPNANGVALVEIYLLP